MKRPALARGIKPLQRHTGLARSTTPLPQQRAKRIAERPARDRCEAKVLARDPMCRRCRVRPSTEVHELQRGQMRALTYLDPKKCIGLCGPKDGMGVGCHYWVTHNPEAAHAEGFAKWSWE